MEPTTLAYEKIDTPFGGSRRSYEQMETFLNGLFEKNHVQRTEAEYEKETIRIFPSCRVVNFYSCDVRESHWILIEQTQQMVDFDTLVKKIEEQLQNNGEYRRRT